MARREYSETLARPPAATRCYNPGMASTTLSAADAFRATLDLFGTGVDLMRQNLRRRHPAETDDEIEARLLTWLRHRPGAESGDGRGRSVGGLP